MSRRTRAWVIAVLIGYFLVQLIGLRSAGLTDDDDFYIPAGISYAKWLGDVVRFDTHAFTRPAVDASFKINNEHPPLAKYVFGVCHFAFRKLLGPYDSARVGTILFSTLAAAMLLWMCLSHLGERRGLRVGVLSVLALLTLPRFYFHSHAATLDVPVAALYMATAALALRAERSKKAAWAVGPVFGLAAATKLNAPFFLFAYLPFILLIRWGRSDDSARDKRFGLVLPSVPFSILTMAILGPVVFFLVWPWMWFDLVPRVTAYVSFHLHHYGIYFLYFGRIFSSNPFAPWHAPFVMAASTVPLATSVLAVLGITAAVAPIRARLAFKDGPDDDYRREGDLLLFAILNAFTTIGVVAFAGTPIYGGAKLFMPFFPFWCLLAGFGAETLWRRLEEGLPTRDTSKGRGFLRLAPALLVTVLVSSGLMLQLRFGAYALSAYNGLVGGTRGATAIGFERQYYDVAFRDLVEWLSEEAPPNLKVHFLPNNWEYVRTYNWYRRGKELRKDIHVVRSEAQADWIVITHERRFARYGDDLRRVKDHPILREKIVDGAPIWTVLERAPRSRSPR